MSSQPEHAISPDEPGHAYSHSLLGEYARKLLILVAVGLVIFFAWKVWQTQAGIIYLVESAVLLALMCFLGGPRAVRAIVLIVLAVNITSILANASYLMEEGAEAPGPAVVVLLVSLVVAVIFELVELLRVSIRQRNTKFLFWLLLAIPALIYAAGVPLFDLLFDSLQPASDKLATEDPDWSVINEISFRTLKFGVFAFFTYVGACLGSFLNVAAHSLPRGEAVGLRDSYCPKCKAKISRIDNLPIFSYLNLGGRCRSCKTDIPFRYLAVELIAAFIFGSLFLYELVAACTNMPYFMGYPHKGVLWIILYPKWPVIGAYLFHVVFMCGLLTLALVEWDNQRLKWWQLGLALLVMAGLAASVPTLITVAVDDHSPLSLPWKSALVDQILRPVVGAVPGLLLGYCAGVSLAGNWQIPCFAFALTGAVLGWQGLLQVTGLFLILLAAGLLVPQTRDRIKDRPTSVLLAAVMLHHPFWSTLFGLW